MCVPMTRAYPTECQDFSFYFCDSPNFLSMTIMIHIGLMTRTVLVYTQHPIWALKFILRFFDPGFGNTYSRHKAMLYLIFTSIFWTNINACLCAQISLHEFSSAYIHLGHSFIHSPMNVGPCHHGMARPRFADGGTASNMEGSCE